MTGASGQIGSTIVRALASVDCHVVRISRRPFQTRPDGPAVVHDIVGDIGDPALWDGLPRAPEIVFHLAAQTSTYAANRDPASDLAANLVPMILLLEKAKRWNNHPAIVFASTATIAGVTTRVPVDESSPDAPVTIYDLHKQLAEDYLRTYVRLGHVRGVALRLSNVYGPGPPAGAADRGVLNAMARRAIAGAALRLYRPGTQVRDYLYIDDAANAFLAAAFRGRLDGGRYLVGSGTGHTIAQMFSLVVERAHALTGRRSEILAVDPPDDLSPIESRSFVADTRRFRELTGWAPATGLPDGIDATIRSFGA